MQAHYSSYLKRWLAHIHYLAVEIGPRGPTTEGERRGAEYCQQVLAGLGLPARLEPFAGAWTIFRPHVFFALAMLAAFALYPLGGRVSAGLAALLSAAALVSELMELSFAGNPLRWLVRKAPSQNAVAVLSPAGEHHQDLVLVGHVDTQRTPVFFRTPGWVSVYQGFTTVAFVLFAAQVLLYLLGTLTQWPWIWPASIPCALCALTMIVFFLHADRTPFTAGANDNATAAGLVLALAEALYAEPPQHTRVWLVCTGCEETQHYGAIDFYRRHRDELVRPVSVVLEMLGCAGPAWLTQEGIVVPFRADPALVALAEDLAREHPEWGAYPVQIKGGNTEMADALRAGIPAIAILGQEPDGTVPYWHQVGDTVDKLDPRVMARAYGFVWAFVQALDARAQAGVAAERNRSGQTQHSKE
jgi:hypothetical protein